MTHETIDDMRITTVGVSQFEGALQETYTNGTSSNFMGLVDNTGMNTINSFTLQDTDDLVRYFFNSQTGVSAAPEPSSLTVLALLATGGAIRRRQRTI